MNNFFTPDNIPEFIRRDFVNEKIHKKDYRKMARFLFTLAIIISVTSLIINFL